MSSNFHISRETTKRLLIDLTNQGYLTGEKKDPTKSNSAWIYKKGFKKLDLFLQLNIKEFKEEIDLLVETAYNNAKQKTPSDYNVDYFKDGF